MLDVLGPNAPAGVSRLQCERQSDHLQRVLHGGVPLRPQPAQPGNRTAHQQRHGHRRRQSEWRRPLAGLRLLRPGRCSTRAASVDPITGHDVASGIEGQILLSTPTAIAEANDLLAIIECYARNLLFGNAGAGGDDLIARDVQRGRDNGIPERQRACGPHTGCRAARALVRSPAMSRCSRICSRSTATSTLDAFEGGSGRGPRPWLRRRPAVPGDHRRSGHASP